MHCVKISVKLAVLVLSVYVLTTVQAAGTGSAKIKQANVVIPEGVIPDRLVIKFKDNRLLAKTAPASGIGSVDAVLQKNNIVQLQQVIGRFEKLRSKESSVGVENIYYARILGGSPVEAAAELSQDLAVEYAEPLYYDKLHATPNDTLFGQQGHFNAVLLPEAWDLVKGEDGEVIVAIVDGGTDITHPDIAPNLWVNPGEVPGNGIDDDGNGFVDDMHGWNFANNSPDPSGLSSTPANANHGSHTAGIACAATDNVTGGSGASWNARLMAINTSAADQDNTIETGYDGILYAADNGAQVVSLSWGRTGAPSQFQQDIINFANESDVTVVASAGNANNSDLNFPGAYDNVLAVASTRISSDTKSGFSNFGSWVDIAAPGSSILSTINRGNYGFLSGTSMSTPLVAGVVALVRTQNTQLSAAQAAEQVRVTADDINNANPFHQNLLGRGRVNALRALTETPPSIRITDVQFVDQNRDEVIQPQETVEVFLTLKNFLSPASNIQLRLSEQDAFTSVIESEASLTSLATDGEATLTVPFQFTTDELTPSGHPIEFFVEISADNYEDFGFFTLTVLPTFGTAEVNNVDVTVTNVGRIGFADPNNSGGGAGFSFQNGPNLLFEGALIAGTAVNQISNAARGTPGNFDDDFTVSAAGDLKVFTPGDITAQETIGIFQDTQAFNPMNIRITQETFAEAQAPNDDYILIKYAVENIGAELLTNFHLGVFFDWDIDGGTFDTNIADYDPARKLGYCFDSGDGPQTYVGMSVLNRGDVHYRAIYNNSGAPNPSWAVNDGFGDLEKWEAISGGIEFTTAGPADVSFTIATGPFDIEPDDRIIIGFALLGGNNLADLQQNADAAQDLWRTLELDEGISPLPEAFALQQNYPNPFNPNTTIQYDLPEARSVRLEIFNILGQRVRMLLESEQQPAGFHTEEWDGRDDDGTLLPTGVYVFRLVAGEFSSTRKMLLVR